MQLWKLRINAFLSASIVYLGYSTAIRIAFEVFQAIKSK
jgi:hypothetical protein